MRLKEAAAYLGISTRKLWNEANAGHLKSARVGTCRIFTRAELDRFIAVRMAANT